MKLRVPHTFVLLFGLIVLAAALTWVLPAGQYERKEINGHQVIDPASYHDVERTPAGFADVFMAYPRGLSETGYIVFFIFIIGGAFGVIHATGAIDAGIHWLVWSCRRRGTLVVPLLTFIFAIGGGTFGMAEETLVFLPTLLVLSRRLGYDDITAGAIALVGAGAGFSGAFFNPFTVGVGQSIAGLPLFSGLGYRLLVWAVMTAIAVIYVTRYARRVRKTPEVAVELTAPRISATEARVLIVVAAAFVTIMIGATVASWGILEITGLFVGVAVLTGVVGGLSGDATAEKFLNGAASMTTGALVVGLARGIVIIFDHARVTDALLHGMAGAVAHLPASVSILGIYAVQVMLSIMVPSGGGQAALSLPILVPLGNLMGITRQTSVLAYQFGDGFTNIFTPTSGYFMAALALIGVPWSRWARFMLPLMGVWLAAGVVLLLIANAIHWGPF